MEVIKTCPSFTLQGCPLFKLKTTQLLRKKMKTEIQEFTLTNKNQYQHSIKDSKTLIAACPSFNINSFTREIELKPFLQFSNLQLIACFTQIKSPEIKALLGIGWLLWDELLLQSIKNKNKSLAINLELKSKTQEKEIIFIAQKNPNFDNVKEKVQQIEKNWLKTQNFKDHESKFICSGDLLEDPKCHLIFQQLKKLYQEEKFKNCIDGLANSFIKKYFEKLLVQDIICAHDQETDPKKLAKEYMTEYFLFENAAFAHLALQGFPLLICKERNLEVEKAMSMVMAYFSQRVENPLKQKMQIAKITFLQKSPPPSLNSAASSNSSSRSVSPKSSPDSSPPSSPVLSSSRYDERLKAVAAILSTPEIGNEFKVQLINELTKKNDAISINNIDKLGFWSKPTWTNMAIAIGIMSAGASILSAAIQYRR